MALPFYNWSRTSASNATADATVNWQEGQLPSSVNDSARAMMASTAAFRDDISGAIVTGGSSTAYTVASYQVFDTLAHLANQMIAFTPHATNGATVTLNVDGLGAKPLRPAPSIELQSNVLILGTPYVAVYNNSDAVFYLHGMGSNMYGIPLAGGMDFWGATAPSSAFAFPAGQAISRSTYATLFSIMSTTYGAGDGSTTFNLPDKTGRVSAMKEASATRLTTAGGGVDGATMGSAAGAQNRTVAQANLPSVNFAVSLPLLTIPMEGRNYPAGFNAGTAITLGDANLAAQGPSGGVTSTPLTVTQTGTGTAASGGSGTALMTVQPTIICNYILRII